MNWLVVFSRNILFTSFGLPVNHGDIKDDMSYGSKTGDVSVSSGRSSVENG